MDLNFSHLSDWSNLQHLDQREIECERQRFITFVFNTHPRLCGCVSSFSLSEKKLRSSEAPSILPCQSTMKTRNNYKNPPKKQQQQQQQTNQKQTKRDDDCLHQSIYSYSQHFCYIVATLFSQALKHLYHFPLSSMLSYVAIVLCVITLCSILSLVLYACNYCRLLS